jgi:hypothetical protein
MKVLITFKDKRCYDVFSERLKDNDDREIATGYLLMAGRAAEPSLWPRLEKGEPPDAAVAACKVLRDIGSNQSKSRLEALKKSAEAQEVQNAAQEALTQIAARKQ